MLNWFLELFGFTVVYDSEFGTHDHRYDSLDRMMGRPIHKDMSVAPPWARMRIIKRRSRV